jgi:hypothetical protein
MTARGYLGAMVCVLGASVVIARTQPKLANAVHALRARQDVSILPPPESLHTMSLGYKAAMVDALWAKLLVEYGIHHSERRRFPDLDRYVDAIVHLEPTYKNLYRYLDALMAFRPGGASEADIRKARQVLEVGIAVRPWDPDIWLAYGDFLTFLAQSYLKDEDEITRWRREGAEALLKATELGATAARADTAASILSKTGERDALIRQLRRTYAVQDSDEARARIAAKLEQLESSAARDRIEAHALRIDRRWQDELPFVPRPLYLLVGPLRDESACIGTGLDRRLCPRDFRDLSLGEEDVEVSEVPPE